VCKIPNFSWCHRFFWVHRRSRRNNNLRWHERRRGPSQPEFQSAGWTHKTMTTTKMWKESEAQFLQLSIAYSSKNSFTQVWNLLPK
jgi:hypothetical protein